MGMVGDAATGTSLTDVAVISRLVLIAVFHRPLRTAGLVLAAAIDFGMLA